MNKPTITFCALSVVLTTLVASQASFASQKGLITAGHINVAQGKQAKSIEQGISVGKLTPKEARKLRAEQLEINQLERSMREDGVMTTEELSTLFARLESSRKHINRLARNSISTSAKTGASFGARDDQGRIIRSEEQRR